MPTSPEQFDDLIRADDMLLYYDNNNDNLEGSGIKKGLFTKQLNEYNKKNHLNLSMREFANLVMKDNSFKKSTKKRAVFYLNLRGGGCGSSTPIAPEPIQEGNDDDGMVDEEREDIRRVETTRQRNEERRQRQQREREEERRAQARITRQQNRIREMRRR
jgi:hypothetical protein